MNVEKKWTIVLRTVRTLLDPLYVTVAEASYWMMMMDTPAMVRVSLPLNFENSFIVYVHFDFVWSQISMSVQ